MKKRFLALVLGILASVSASGSDSGQTSRRVVLHSQFDTRDAYSGSWAYAARGREYALVGEQSGTMFVDITDPASPVEVGFIPGPISSWRELKTYGTYAYIVSEGNGVGAGLQIVNLAALPAR